MQVINKNINHTICDKMNSIENSKIILSEVRQLLHITLTIPVTSATAERTFSAMRRYNDKPFFSSFYAVIQTYTLYLINL